MLQEEEVVEARLATPQVPTREEDEEEEEEESISPQTKEEDLHREEEGLCCRKARHLEAGGRLLPLEEICDIQEEQSKSQSPQTS